TRPMVSISPNAFPFMIYDSPFFISIPESRVAGASAQERFEDGRVGSGDDVGADQLADAGRGLGAGLDGRADAADVPAAERRDEPADDLHAPGQVHVRSLEHRVGGLDHADQALGLDQAEGLAVEAAPQARPS